MNHLTGNIVVDYATASATGLFDIYQKQWSTEVVDFLGISTCQLADLADTNQIFAILPEIQQYFSFSEKAKVMIGASDGTLAAYASFYSTGRKASLTIGTSAAVRQITNEIQLDHKKQNFCYYLNNDFVVSGAPSNNGGCVLSWASDQLAEKSYLFFAELPSILTKAAIGAEGLRFWPFLNGERAPYWTNQIKGGFKDLTIQHTREDLIRSVIEGILLNIKRLVDLVSIDEALSVSGGFFPTLELGLLAADVFWMSSYFAPESEPIFGLYYLLEKPQITHEESQQIFLPKLANSQKYDKLAASYFM